MNANDVKEALNDTDIFDLLVELGAEPIQLRNGISCRTICHNPAHEGKHKLMYYSNSHMFHCFTGSCGTFSIFNLVMKVMGMEFYDSFKFVCEKFGISYKDNNKASEIIDTSFFRKFNQLESQDEDLKNFKIRPLDKRILNSYSNLYHSLWIKDNISIKTMKKFNIKYSILDNQIIIPHYDLNGNLIGVRARNLNEDLVNNGKKYMPVYYKGKFLKHATGANLFGLNFNKENINRYKKIILFEAEKSVMQLDTMNPKKSIGVSISGSSLTNFQLEILNSLSVQEVIIALDKEYENYKDKDAKFYAQKITNGFINKLSNLFQVSIIWDTQNLLNKKDSPTDHGKEVFNKLFKKRIVI